MIDTSKPLLISLKLVGLFPNWPVPSSAANSIAPIKLDVNKAKELESQVFTQPRQFFSTSSVGYKTYAIILVIVAWLNAFRLFSVFRWHWNPQVESVAMFLHLSELFAYTVTAAVARLILVIGSWRQRFVIAFSGADDDDSLFFKLHDNHHIKSYQTRRNVILMGAFCMGWSSWFINSSFVPIALSVNRTSVIGWATPLDEMLPRNDTNFLYWSTIGGIFASLVPDLGLYFALLFFALLTVNMAWKFHNLGNAISEHAERAANMVTSEGGGSNDKASASECELAEQIRERHFQLLRTVRLLDRDMRFAIFASAVFGFFSTLIHLYLAVSANSDVIRFFESCWSISALVKLLLAIMPSAYLERCADKMREKLFSLRFHSKDCATVLQTSLLLSQVTSEPVALTLLGVVRLRRKTVAGLLSAMFTYFLILMDYASRGKGLIPQSGMLAMMSANNTTSTLALGGNYEEAASEPAFKAYHIL